MSKKILMLLLGLICALGGTLSVYLYTNTDREGPRIQLVVDDILYHENEDISILLEGVTAVDDVDGDVTDSLIVEAIYPSADGTKAKIVYAAMDSSNNVTKKERVVDYVPEETAETGAGNASADEPEETVGVDANAALADETDESSSIAGNNKSNGGNNASNSESNTGNNENDTGSTNDGTEVRPTMQTENESGTANSLTYANAKIAVVNGSGVAGVAGDWQDYLEDAGYTSVQTGSYKAKPKDTIIYTDNEELAQELLTYFPNASVEERMPVDDVDITLDSIDVCVVVGPQYTEVPET